MNLTYLETLLLREISLSKAEIFKDREPETVYINNNYTKQTETLPIIIKFREMGLIEQSFADDNKEEYKISESGKNALVVSRLKN